MSSTIVKVILSMERIQSLRVPRTRLILDSLTPLDDRLCLISEQKCWFLFLKNPRGSLAHLVITARAICLRYIQWFFKRKTIHSRLKCYSHLMWVWIFLSALRIQSRWMDSLWNIQNGQVNNYVLWKKDNNLKKEN